MKKMIMFIKTQREMFFRFLRAVFLIISFILVQQINVFSLTVTGATLEICGDDECYVYINGVLAFETQSIPGIDWTNTYTVDVSSYLFCGDYVLAINYYDTASGAITLTYKLTMHLDDGSTRIIYSEGSGEKQILNGNYLDGTQTFPTGWNEATYDDSGWTDPVYTCTSTRITDTAFTGGYVPYISPFSGCNVPTGGQSVLCREKFNILCPLVNITKSVNKGEVAIGETITYCLSYNNTDSKSWTFGIWDTIPSVTDFAGCDHGCTTQTYGSNVVVNWPVTVAAGASGSVCVWVAANRYSAPHNKRRPYVLPVWESGLYTELAGAGGSP